MRNEAVGATVETGDAQHGGIEMTNNEPRCSGSSCQSATTHTPCECKCGGSRHGLHRIAWAAAGAKYRAGVRTDRVASLVDEWTAAREAAVRVVRKLTQAQRDRRANVSADTLEHEPMKRLQNGQVHGSAEFLRTEVLVGWLVEDHSTRARIEALANELSTLGADVLDRAVGGSRDEAAARRRIQRRLGDHFWCDMLAALVVALQEIQDVKDALVQSVADASADLVTVVWREVQASRRASHGWGPTSGKEGPTRSEADGTAGVSEAFLEAVTRHAVRRLVRLMPWPDLGLDQAVFELRVLTLMICPDPAGHELVWTNCWLPLVERFLQEEIAEELRQLDQFVKGGLAQQHTWDRVRPTGPGTTAT